MRNLITDVSTTCSDIISDERICTSGCLNAINDLKALGLSLEGCKETHLYYHKINKIINDAEEICSNGYIPNGSLQIQLILDSVIYELSLQLRSLTCQLLLL